MAVLATEGSSDLLTDPFLIRQALRSEGVHYDVWPVDNLDAHLWEDYSLTPEEQQQILDFFARPMGPLMEANGYVKADIVVLSEQTPNLENLLNAFAREHHHAEDEVRFVIHGHGIFDLIGRSGREYSIVVEAGDLLVIPSGMRHRFALSDDRQIKCIRLFQSPAGWLAIYDSPRSAAQGEN